MVDFSHSLPTIQVLIYRVQIIEWKVRCRCVLSLFLYFFPLQVDCWWVCFVRISGTLSEMTSARPSFGLSMTSARPSLDLSMTFNWPHSQLTTEILVHTNERVTLLLCYFVVRCQLSGSLNSVNLSFDPLRLRFNIGVGKGKTNHEPCNSCREDC